MKLLLRIGLVVLLIPAMALPAMATLDMGGYVAFDFYYYKQDKEGFASSTTRTTPGSGGLAGLPEGATTDEDDRKQTYYDLNHSSHIWFRWYNDAGVGIFMTPYMNGDPKQSGGDAGFNVGVSNVVGWWDINPSLRIIAGKGGYETIFSSGSPGTTMGYDGVAKVLGIGYGNIVSSYQNGVRFTYKFTPKVSAKLGLLESRLSDNKSPAPIPAMLPYHNKPLLLTEAGTVADNATILPKFELAVPVSFRLGSALLNIAPSGMYLRQTFDNIAPGADDEIVSYGMALGLKAKIKKLAISAEINHGQNFINAGRPGVATSYPFKSEYAATIGYIQSARADATGKVHDSKTTAGWVEVEYTIGRFKPSIFYGRQEMERDMPNADSEATTQFYGINCDINIVNNVILTPEVMIYDDGDGKLMGVDYEFGKELLAGMQLRWRF